MMSVWDTVTAAAAIIVLIARKPGTVGGLATSRSTTVDISALTLKRDSEIESGPEPATVPPL